MVEPDAEPEIEPEAFTLVLALAESAGAAVALVLRSVVVALDDDVEPAGAVSLGMVLVLVSTEQPVRPRANNAAAAAK